MGLWLTDSDDALVQYLLKEDERERGFCDDKMIVLHIFRAAVVSSPFSQHLPCDTLVI